MTADGYSTDEVKPTEQEVFDEVDSVSNGTEEDFDEAQPESEEAVDDDEGYF